MILIFVPQKEINMSKKYKTQGKSKLEEFLCAHPDTHYTVDEVCVAVNGSLSGKSSIYRNLSLLCERGYVRKFKDEGKNCSVYQYIGKKSSCSDHFHLKCIECGHLEHLECYMGDDLCRHIGEHHGFCVDSGRSILYGVCATCREGKKQKITV